MIVCGVRSRQQRGIRPHQDELAAGVGRGAVRIGGLLAEHDVAGIAPGKLGRDGGRRGAQIIGVCSVADRHGHGARGIGRIRERNDIAGVIADTGAAEPSRRGPVAVGVDRNGGTAAGTTDAGHAGIGLIGGPGSLRSGLLRDRSDIDRVADQRQRIAVQRNVASHPDDAVMGVDIVARQQAAIVERIVATGQRVHGQRRVEVR